jgi:3-oxoadipate enol-lactonase
MPTFEHDGWQLSYQDRGRGPAILLIHSLLFDHTVLEPQVSALEDRFRLITPDLRGHGASERRPEERTLWDLMEDQIALLDHLGIERAVWGGASVAGPIALRAALRHPERVSALVLISTQAGPEHPARKPRYEGFAGLVATEGWTEQALMGMARNNFGPGAPAAVVDSWTERWRSSPTDDIGHVMRALTRRESLLDRLAEIEIPALIVYGEDDRVALQPEEVEALAAGLTNIVEFVRIPDAGHTVTLEKPAAVNAALSRFLSHATK